MRTSIVISIVLMHSVLGDGPVPVVIHDGCRFNPPDHLACAMALVESGGNPDICNEREDAVGILQIRPVMVREVNRIGDVEFTLDDRWNVCKSLAMLDIHERHGIGVDGSHESIARTWNGGPKGMGKDGTDIYWTKVKRRLHERKVCPMENTPQGCIHRQCACKEQVGSH